MRALLPALAGAQALGILLADRVEPPAEAAWVTAGVLLVAALALRRGPPRHLVLIAAAFATGVASLAGPLEAARDPSPLPVEALVEATAGRVAWQGDRVRVDWVDARAVGPERVPPRLRTWSERDARFPAELQRPLPGERWRQRLRLRRPEAPRNPGALDPVRSLARRGIAATGRPVHPALAVRVGSDGEGPRRRLALVRRRRAERLVAAGRGGALLAALALGERGGLPEDVRRDFARLGLAHLLAVSGLHLALVAGVVFALARAVLARAFDLAARHDARRGAAAAALVGAAGYAAASGFAVPVERALVLLVAGVLALVLRRPRRSAAPLSLASFVLLAAAPHALFEAGFQLSFAATAALLFSRPKPAVDAPHARQGPGSLRGGGAGLVLAVAGLRVGLARLRHGLESLLHTSASALLATGPIVAFHFGAGAPVGLVANLVAIPATAFLLLPAAGVAALAAGFDGATSRALIEAAAAPAAAALAAVSAVVGALPPSLSAAPRIASPPALGLAAALAVVGLRCAGTRARLAVLLAQSLWLAWVPPAPLSPPPPRVVALDVGQGDAIVVQGRRAVLVVDAGRRLSGHDVGERVVAPALAALGVRRIDRLAVTHADLDHRGGVPVLVERFRVGAIWLPRGSAGDPGFAPVRAAAARRGVPILERGRGDPAERLGDLRVEFLWPPPGRPASRNEGSLVLRVGAVDGGAVLLPGDVGETSERTLVEARAALASEVLLLPHHGSRTSSSVGFLAAVSPRIAVVSAPCLGRFAMPDLAVRARVADLGVPLRWTGRDGAVIVGLSLRSGAAQVAQLGERRHGCFGDAPSGASRAGFP